MKLGWNENGMERNGIMSCEGHCVNIEWNLNWNGIEWNWNWNEIE